MKNLTKAFLKTVEESGDLKILSPNETFEMLGTKEEFELSQRIDEDGDDLMEENNKLDLMESQLADCEEFNN